MVTVSNIHEFIREIYEGILGDRALFLIIGGSLGRGNYIDGWSDADLLLVLSDIDSNTLMSVKQCEKRIFEQFHIDVDTMIIDKNTIERTPSKNLHGKVKNFLFFISKAVVLIRREVDIPSVDYDDFIYGFWATYAEQAKNFLRRNADINSDDREDMERLLKKNIKIIFLLLKQCFSMPTLVPCTYDEVLLLVLREFSQQVCSQLESYVKMRENDAIRSFSREKLESEIVASVNLFQNISDIMNQRLSGNA
jgi:hypothetical protein